MGAATHANWSRMWKTSARSRLSGSSDPIGVRRQQARSAPRSSRTTRSPSRAHTRRGGVSPQLQCMIKGDETRGVVACAYDTDLLVQSHGLQNLAFARARPASAASSASASASTSASASASASEFEKGLHAVIDDIIEDAVTKGYHYPAEPLCRSRNLRMGSSVADLFALGTGDDDH